MTRPTELASAQNVGTCVPPDFPLRYTNFLKWQLHKNTPFLLPNCVHDKGRYRQRRASTRSCVRISLADTEFHASKKGFESVDVNVLYHA